MKYFLIAGEASGDLHGSNLIDALIKNDSNAEFEFWGGDMMAKAANKKPNKHVKDLAIMGFVEVVMRLNEISKNIKACKSQILQFKPDAIIFIDYPGFNLRIAPFAKQNGIKTFYYISPKVWAWKEKRVFKIKKYIDTLFCIFPFEVEFYKKFDYQVEYIGNPLMDAVEKFKNSTPDYSWLQTQKPIIAILPGSRKQELERILPTMLEAVKDIDSHDFIIAGAPNFMVSDYEKFFKNKKYQVVFNSTYSLLSKAEAAIVTSGTATLETALFRVPKVVCYKANQASYIIGKSLVKIKFMALDNLILEKEAVKELLQDQANPKEINKEIKLIVKGGKKRQQILDDYDLLYEKIGKSGASDRAAKLILKALRSNVKI